MRCALASSKLLPCLVLSQLIRLAICSTLSLHLVEDISTSPLPSSTLFRRQSSFEVVTGIQGYGVQPRLEIRQLQQNADQWNIYLLGLARFQASNQSEKTSYYHIAGRCATVCHSHVGMLTRWQAFTVAHMSHGMASIQVPVRLSQDTARMS